MGISVFLASSDNEVFTPDSALEEPSKFSFAVWEIESSTDIVLACSFAEVSVEPDLQKPHFMFNIFKAAMDTSEAHHEPSQAIY